jgi:hypothetical protein
MNVETTLETNAQFAETGKPGMHALDSPAIPAEPLLTFHTATRNTCRDAARVYDDVPLRSSATA